MGGTLVALTTHKKLLSRLVTAESRWLPVSRHEISLGGFYAWAVVARRAFCES